MKILFLFIFLLSAFQVNAKIITSFDYYNVDDMSGFQKNCLKDVIETNKKIENKSLKLELQRLWEVKFISLICKYQNGLENEMYDDLIFFINSYENDNINLDNHEDIFFMFNVIILPFIQSSFPNLNYVSEFSNEDYEEIIELFKENKDYILIDKFGTSGFNSMIAFYVARLFQDNQYDKGLSLLENDLILNKKSQFDYYSYINAFGIKISGIKNRSDKVDFYKEFISEVDEYFTLYEISNELLDHKIMALSQLIYQLSKLERFDEAHQIIDKIDFQNLEKIIPDTNIALKQSLIDLYFKSSRSFGLDSYDTFFEKNYDTQIFYASKGISIILDEVLYSQNIYLSIDDRKNFIDKNIFNLEHFIFLTTHYDIYAGENNIDSKKYWDIFFKSFKISQLLSQNEVNQSVNNIFLKHNIKNKIDKKLFNQKLDIEKIIAKQSKKILDENQINKNDINFLNDYKKNKISLDKINNELIKRNTVVDNKLIDYREFATLIKENEMLIFIHEGKYFNHIYYFAKNFASRTFFSTGNKSELSKDIKTFINYTRNTKNYNSNKFPNDLAYNIGNSLFYFKDFESQSRFENINHFTIIANKSFSTFPYWLLLTDKVEKFKFYEINQYPWFSKKYSYSISISLNDFINKNQKIRLGISITNENEIVEIYENSLAEKSNLKIDDRIISINNKKIKNNNEFLNTLDNLNQDKNFKLKIERDNKFLEVNVVVSKKSIFEDLSNTIKINFKNSKEYDFVGIGNPVLSNNIYDDKKFDSIVNDIYENYETRGILDTKSISFLPELPETEKELKNIQKNFNINKTKLFLGNQAKESILKKFNFTNTKFIVFATHALISDEIDGLKEPGIVLTPSTSIKESKLDDGLLLASEISNLDLINTDLVVLSACNTSSGMAESIPLSGLAKSFFLAGVKSLIVTGWSVESDSSAFLSTNIFNKVIKDKISYSKALQLSINDMIKENKHPLMWGPFIVIGDN